MPAIKDYMKFMAKYYSDGNAKESLNIYAYTVTSVLRDCWSSATAISPRKHHGPGQQPQGPRSADAVAGRPRQHQPHQPPSVAQMQLQRWEGQGYVRFGNIIEGANL